MPSIVPHQRPCARACQVRAKGHNKSFYQRLLAGTSRRQALREAQLALRKDFPDPFFWAAFGLTGAGD